MCVVYNFISGYSGMDVSLFDFAITFEFRIEQNFKFNAHDSLAFIVNHHPGKSLLCLHCWVFLPKLLNFRKSRLFTLSYYGHTYVKEANILPSKVGSVTFKYLRFSEHFKFYWLLEHLRITQSACQNSSFLCGLTSLPDIIILTQVVHLEIGRPKGFRFNAGDYIFVNIPKIARYEWHPFTISSSAEGKSPLSLHVR